MPALDADAATDGEDPDRTIPTRLYVLASADSVVYVDLDPTTRALTERGRVTLDLVASNAWISGHQRRLYGLSADTLIAYALDPVASTQMQLGSQALGASGASDLWVHASGHWVVVGNGPPSPDLQTPELALIALRADGAPAGSVTRVAGSTAVANVVADPTGRHVFGLACERDTISHHVFDADSGTLVAGAPAPAGIAASDLAFHPKLEWAYATRESVVQQLSYDKVSGQLQARDATPYQLPSELDAGGTWCWNSRIVAHPSGRFVYVLLQEGGGNLYTFAVAPDTGRLTRTHRLAYVRFRAPTSLALDRSGRFLFAGGGANVFHLFALDPNTGEPSFVDDVPGTGPGGSIIGTTEI
jgi:6-phosphogluconolactonase (cycloisomerase 2 family)